MTENKSKEKKEWEFHFKDWLVVALLSPIALSIVTYYGSKTYKTWVAGAEIQQKGQFKEFLTQNDEFKSIQLELKKINKSLKNQLLHIEENRSIIDGKKDEFNRQDLEKVKSSLKTQLLLIEKNQSLIEEKAPLKLFKNAVLAIAYEKCPDGWSVMPTSIGRFLRGHDPMGLVDKDGKERTIGSIQDFATALPNKSAFTLGVSGNHSHKITGSLSNGINTNNSARRGNGDSNPGEYHDDGGVSSSGEHDHVIGGGDTETRPTNVAVLFCIK